MRGAAARPEDHARAPAVAPVRPVDVRDVIFAGLEGRLFSIALRTSEPGVLAGVERLFTRAAELGLHVDRMAAEGASLEPGSPILLARGDAWQVARSEDQLIGAVAKASGVATAAAGLVARAAGRARVVCGAWKKVPAEVRADLRSAAATGGVGTRIVDGPFAYLDKNFVRMLGGVGPAVRRARGDRAVVVQLRGETAPIADEALEAVESGADVLMVDTGSLGDLSTVTRLAAQGRLGRQARVAFAGGVGPATLDDAIDAGAAIVDVGRAILDAPMLDLRLDVT